MVALVARTSSCRARLLPLADPHRRAIDRLFRLASLGSALLVLIVLAGILGSMIYGGLPAFREFGLGFITSSVWNVNEDQYGAWVAIVGTLSTALIALVIGVPLSLGIAIFLTQLCPPWLKRPVATTIELLAAVPSIIYGMWGLFVFAPLFANYVQIPVSNIVEGMPDRRHHPLCARALRRRHPDGRHHPRDHDHSLHRLDRTRHSRSDPVGAARERLRHRLHHLGGRAPRAAAAGRRQHHRRRHARPRPRARRDDGGDLRGRQRQPPVRPRCSIPGSTIASRIANEFNEAIGLQLNALMALGCILFLVTFAVLVLARFLVVAREGGSEGADHGHRSANPRAPTTAAPAPWGRVRRSRHVADRALKIVCTLFTILGAIRARLDPADASRTRASAACRRRSSPRRRRGPAPRAAASPTPSSAA